MYFHESHSGGSDTSVNKGNEKGDSLEAERLLRSGPDSISRKTHSNPQSENRAANSFSVQSEGPDVSDVLDALPFYVLLVDDDHRILKANKAVQAQFGLEPEQIVGQYCPKVIHGLDEPWYACPLEEAVEKGASVERVAFDEASGRWIRSVVYPTRRQTRDGKGIFFHMVADVTDEKRAEEEVISSREQLRSLSAHLESVREAERTKVAREVHDELGQILTALKIDLSWLARRLSSEQALLEKVESVKQLLDTAIQTVKRISVELRPGVLDDLGLGAAIEWQGQDFEKRTEIAFEFQSGPKDIVVDRDCSTALFRILQEALTNVVRHANASRVKVSLGQEDGTTVLKIADNGRGIREIELSCATAFGLIGMRERARSLGGDLLVSGSRREGTTVVATIPPSHARCHAKDTDRR